MSFLLHRSCFVVPVVSFLTVTLVLCDVPVCGALRQKGARPIGRSGRVILSLTWSLPPGHRHLVTATWSLWPGRRAGVTEMRPLRTYFCCRIYRTARGSPPVALIVSGASFQRPLPVFDREGPLCGSHYMLRFRQTCFRSRFHAFRGEFCGIRRSSLCCAVRRLGGYGSGLIIDGIRARAHRPAPTATPTD